MNVLIGPTQGQEQWWGLLLFSSLRIYLFFSRLLWQIFAKMYFEILKLLLYFGRNSVVCLLKQEKLDFEKTNVKPI